MDIQSLWPKVSGHRLAGLDDAMRLRQVPLAEHSLIGFSLGKGLSDELVGPFLGLVLGAGHDAGHDERHGGC